MTELAKAYVQIIPTTRNLGANLRSEMSGELEASGDSAGQSFGSRMVSAIKGVLVAAGIGQVISNAINVGSELEQNLGGTEAVWQGYADTIQSKAQTAWQNMGMSASEYMATANKVGALMQGSGIEQSQAVQMTADAMQRAADVASVMGISTEDAMNAIAGAAKGNFTMMDNIGVAMNATTLEAYAQSKGIEGFTYANATNAEKTTLAMQMFMEQTSQYAGNFARESNDTISGSLGALKSAWTDLLGDLALGNEIDLTPLLTSLTNVANNIIPVISNIVVQLPNALVQLATQLAPTLATQGTNMLIQLINGFATTLPTMIPQITQCILSILMALVQALPDFILAGGSMITALVEGVIASIPLIIEQVPVLIEGILTAINDNLPVIIEGGVNLFVSLIHALPEIIKQIAEILPSLVTGIVNSLIDNIGLIIEAGITLFCALVEAIPQIIIAIIPALGQLISGIGENLMSFYYKFIEIGTDLILGLKQGILNAWDTIWGAVKGFCSDIIDGVKGFFGIGSPSKLFAEYGGFLMEGFAIGVDDKASLVTDSIHNVSNDIADSMKYDLGSSASLSLSGYESGEAYLSQTLSAAIGEQKVAVYLDGKQLSDSVTKYQRYKARAMA